MNVDELTFDVSQEVEIKAAPGTVYKNMITQLSQIMGGESVVEPTVAAEAVLPVLPAAPAPLFLATDEADASVLPAKSSMTWA